MKLNKPKLILCDFDGVLSRFNTPSKKEGFYSPLSATHPTLYKNVINLLFTSSNHLCKAWMCGQINYADVNTLLAHKFGVDRNDLDTALFNSIQKFTLNRELITLLQEFRNSGTPVVIMSDNMDVFTQHVVPYFGLHTFFDAIFSSSDLQKMKSHTNWELPKEIAKKYHCDYPDVLVIDDWEELTVSLSNLGFRTFLYHQKTHAAFNVYANKLLQNNIPVKYNN